MFKNKQFRFSNLILAILLTISLGACTSVDSDVSTNISNAVVETSKPEETVEPTSTPEVTETPNKEEVANTSEPEKEADPSSTEETENNFISMQDAVQSIPAWIGSPFVALNDNVPFFVNEDINFGEVFKDTLEIYYPLDQLGRPQGGFALVCKDTMPTEERGSIGSVKPPGWHTVKIGRAHV